MQATSEALNLSVQQSKQTDAWVTRHDRTVDDRLRDAYVWAFYPEQHDPARPFTVTADRVPDSGGKPLAERVSAKLAREDLLVGELGAAILGATLHHELGALWSRDGEITVGELWGYFTRYVYLPRLLCRDVLDAAVARAVDEVLVADERFAIATSKDQETGRYRGLVLPPAGGVSVPVTDSTVLVAVEKAQAQLAADRAQAGESGEGPGVAPGAGGGPTTTHGTSSPGSASSGSARHGATGHGSPSPAPPTRWFGSVRITDARYTRKIGEITREVIDQLAGAGADLEITIDIQARKPAGFTDQEVRTVRENAATLGFDPSSAFERG